MNGYTKRRKKFGTIRWAVVLAVAMSVSAVISYIGMSAIRHFYFGIENENYLIWSAAVYQIMGGISGVLITILSVVLYRRMEKLLNAIEDVAKGNLDVQIPLDHAGEYRIIFENFNQMVRELKQADEQQKQFMKDFSHEFKTPINSIKGFAEYLSTNELPKEEEKQYLKIMAEEAGRLGQLSQNMLFLSKLEHMECMKKKEPYRLDEQIRNCIIMMFPAFEEKNMTIEVELPEIWYTGDEEIIAEIWINLLDNARKYSPDGSVVFVKAETVRENIKIEIRDEGMGMDEETKLHLFDRYYQGDSSHETSGFGLGLSIVKKILELCNGSIQIGSMPGEGTSIKILL